MGFAVAEEAARRGADVILVAGPTSVDPPAVADLVRVRSARDMHAAVMARAGSMDVIVMAAAVADYTPAAGATPDKIEKGGAMRLELERTPDILAELGRTRGGARRPVLIGFAAESGPPETRARQKLVAKQVDLIVANDISAPDAGFEVAANRVSFVSAEGIDPVPLMSKTDAAGLVVDRIERLLVASAPAAATR
jgi:phosphopantothenoylcysteine decarboxylase/phosphopantothenate--cysteine ligase